MKYTTIPHTDIKVSKICLGTMTWGQQNTEAEGHAQIDYALSKGVNFLDTAELYPVPAKPSTSGRTSEIIGSWLKKTRKRKDIIIASKIAGPGDYTAHIRKTGFSRQAIKKALDLELERLQTDYIDVYQLHWPERDSNRFGEREVPFDISWEDNLAEILESLENEIKAGRIRHIGISNENSWGAMRYLEEHKHNGLPRIITIQNPYSLLNRLFESDLSEVSRREGLGLLAYSPMAFGILSGKYIKGTARNNSRLKQFPRFARYSSNQCTEATKQYLKIAEDHNLSLAQMSLAFVNKQPFLTSNIIGATNLDQLKENIDSINITLSDEISEQINEVHKEIPNPAP